jgi:hypothetical protein
MLKKNLVFAFIGLLGIHLLTACSSGGDADTTVAGGGRGGTEYGFLNLSISDAPIDKAIEVWVQFDGVELMPNSGSSDQDSIQIMFDQPMHINLLELQGSNSKPLLINEILPTGVYNWINLLITATKDGVMDSYIKLDDGSVHELDMPSESEVGLKIVGGLEVMANKPIAKTIDFDLRKSIVMTSADDFKIKPALSLVSNEQSGSVEGTVKLNTLTSSDCSDTDPETGNAVYLFEGFNVVPDDIDGIDPEPVASALVNLNRTTGDYEYSLGFIPFGKYTAVFTCQADNDDPASDEIIKFTKTKNINISSSKTKILSSNSFR